MINWKALAGASLATGSLLAGTAAVAQPAPPEMTRAAAEQRASEAFERMDVNGDGVLNDADREARARQRFDEADSDGNGQLSFAEATAAQEARRAGHAERRAERAEAFEQRGSMRARRALSMRGGMMGGMEGRRGGGRMLERVDTNADGSVSREEFTAGALARFDRMDANSDGTISADERPRGRGMMRQPG